MDKHDGAFVKFEMKIIKQHFSAFSRLIHESVRIDRNSRDNSISILNSKSEWGSNKLPRLVIERDEKLDSGKVNDFDQIKKDIDFVDKKKGSLSDCGQVGFQSNNANKKHFKFLTPSTTAAPKPNVSGKSTETFRQTNQLTIDRYFRDKFK